MLLPCPDTESVEVENGNCTRRVRVEDAACHGIAEPRGMTRHDRNTFSLLVSNLNDTTGVLCDPIESGNDRVLHE
eukprot:EC686753.1.p4 GENE.EC686753.1~~EC686753.1.p4  ORF type:complete len:75 (-),score=12.75 EC686753.1:233-457(-)